ncbi:MAG: GAF domain-containing protein [Syntrophomonas sp.]
MTGLEYRSVAFSLTKIGTALSSEKRLDRLFNLIVDEIIEFAGCDACSLFIRHDDSANLVFQASRTVSMEVSGTRREFNAVPVKLSRSSIVGYTALTGEILNIPDCYNIQETASYQHNKDYDTQSDYRTVSLLSVPIRYQDGSIVGVIQLINKLDDEGKVVAFPEEMEPLISAVASQAAVAIRNAQLQNIQTESSFVFNSLLLALCGYSFFLAILQRYQGNAWIPTLITAGFSGLFLLISILVIWKTGLPLSFFGITRNNMKKSLLESALATIVAVAALTLFKMWAVKHWGIFQNQPVINWGLWNFSYCTYILIAPIQEFVSRGVLQSSLERSLNDSRFRTFLAIVISSCVFGSFHIFYSLGLALLTVVSGFLWGYLFSRHKNITGISLSHFIIGDYISLLGFWDLLLTI